MSQLFLLCHIYTMQRPSGKKLKIIIRQARTYSLKNSSLFSRVWGRYCMRLWRAEFSELHFQNWTASESRAPKISKISKCSHLQQFWRWHQQTDFHHPFGWALLELWTYFLQAESFLKLPLCNIETVQIPNCSQVWPQIQLSALSVDAKMLWRNNINMALLIDGPVLALTHQQIDHPQLSFPKPIFFSCLSSPALFAHSHHPKNLCPRIGICHSYFSGSRAQNNVGPMQTSTAVSFCFSFIPYGKSVHSKPNKNQKI